ncbi:MAG: response regulator [Clostridia bacterium]|nr:response regulator [Clostridia bacterium]
MLRILFVDDQRVELDGMSQLLDWSEMGLEWAGGVTDAETALEIVKKEQIDIVVTDVIMQHMDGLTLVRLLKQNHPKVRSICISGFDDFKFVGTAINNGASGYVLKPILVNELKSVLERVAGEIRQERALEGLTSGKMAMLLLGAKTEGIDETLLNQPVKLIQSSGIRPENALAGLILEDGNSLWVLPAESSVPDDGWVSDPIPLKQIHTAYFALLEADAAEDSTPASRDDAVMRIRENIEKHLSEDVDTRVLMEGVYLSASHASALFKSATGMSIHRYVVDRRLTEAARILLEDPETRVKDIAWRCGFTDASHLINSFQKKYGMTPEKYRRRHAFHEVDR